jgi:hypothetical protein
MKFVKATKKQAHARVALVGISGSGKTYSALRLARGLSPTGRIAVVDSERGSASKYSDRFEFDVLELDSFSPLTYVQAFEAAAAEGYDVVIADSLSHAWMGRDGALEQVDRRAGSAGSSFNAWRDVTPMQTKMIDAIVRYPGHLIATMRSKAEYVVEKNDKGKSTPRKVGMAPVQRDGLEYEFDVVIDLSADCSALVTKTRCSALTGGAYELITEALGETLRTWLTDGAPMQQPKPAAPATKPAGGKLPPPAAQAEKPAFDGTAALLAIARSGNEAELTKIGAQLDGAPPAQKETLRAVYRARLAELRAASAASTAPESPPVAAEPAVEAATPVAGTASVAPAEHVVVPDSEQAGATVVQMPDKGWGEFLGDIAAATGADTSSWTEDDVAAEYSAVLGSIDKRADVAVMAGDWIKWVNKRSGVRTRALRSVLKNLFDARTAELRAAEQTGATS